MGKVSPRNIVTLCGSTRFEHIYREINKAFTLKGWIVLSCGIFKEPSITPTQKMSLDALHKDKIKISELVYVINYGGYIGESTANEIEFAKKLNIPIQYLEDINEKGKCYDKI